jgi:hypothetical protein
VGYEVQNDKSRIPESRFTIVENDLIRDGRLKRMSRMLMIEILSHAENFVVTEASLVRAGREGRDAVRNALHELEQFGYLERVPLRNGGKFDGVRYVPIRDPKPLPENPSPVDDHGRKTSAGKPVPENPTLKKTKEEDQEEEAVLATLAPAPPMLFAVPDDQKPEPPERGIAQRAHEKTQGAYSFVKVLPIAKWAIHTKGADPAQVERVFADLYKSGRSFSKVIVGQVLDGYGPKQRPTAKTSREIIDEGKAQMARFAAMDEAEEQHRLQLGTGK